MLDPTFQVLMQASIPLDHIVKGEGMRLMQMRKKHKLNYNILVWIRTPCWYACWGRGSYWWPDGGLWNLYPGYSLSVNLTGNRLDKSNFDLNFRSLGYAYSLTTWASLGWYQKQVLVHLSFLGRHPSTSGLYPGYKDEKRPKKSSVLQTCWWESWPSWPFLVLLQTLLSWKIDPWLSLLQ